MWFSDFNITANHNTVSILTNLLVLLSSATLRFVHLAELKIGSGQVNLGLETFIFFSCFDGLIFGGPVYIGS